MLMATAASTFANLVVGQGEPEDLATSIFAALLAEPWHSDADLVVPCGAGTDVTVCPLDVITISLLQLGQVSVRPRFFCLQFFAKWEPPQLKQQKDLTWRRACS